MVHGQDKLVQGGVEGGRDEVFENVWEVAPFPPPPTPRVGEFDS